MKKRILTATTAMLFIAGAILTTSCGTTETKQDEGHDHSKSEGHENSDGHAHEHAASTESPQEIQAEFSGEKTKNLSLIIDSYLELTNALTKDDKDDAAEAGTKLLVAFNGFDKGSLSEDQVAEYNEIEESAIENTEHIVRSPIEHQREHLVILSEDINDIIALVGTDKKLYEDFCPMANDKKGAIWISATKEISNPYMGSKMPKCGKIQSEIN